ncbi:hypothetical protein HYV49_03570 [Candidatus Pacearchaeota archaeon]|nr:hypothetical protein [Candidatus Pacearchaeota archaeon]
MLPKTHILLGAILSVILILILKISIISAIIIFLSSFLIDVDHYIAYVINKKDWSLSNSYKLYKNVPRDHKPMIHFLHTIEFLIVLFILGLYFPLFMLIFLGFIFHSNLDIIEMINKRQLSQREFFLSRYLFKRKTGRYYEFND